jgi:hypothetical protein
MDADSTARDWMKTTSDRSSSIESLKWADALFGNNSALGEIRG